MKAIVNGRLVFPNAIRDGVIVMEGERIIASGDVKIPSDAEIIDANGLFVGPGLSDEHCHGYKQCGECFDINDGVREVSMAHLKHGTTQFLPSPSYGRKKDLFLKIIDDANETIDAGDTNIVGIHFEGPFTSPLHGAKPENAWQYSEENAREIFDRAGENVRHITYAPELPHAEELEALIREYGIVSDIGHTRSDEESILRAVKNGATIATHLFDAMGKHGFNASGDITPGGLLLQGTVAEILLGIPNMYYELICDSRGIHVLPSSMRLAYKCAGEDHIICISDATAHKLDALNPADYPPEDRRSALDLNFNDRGQLSGSRLTAAMSVRNFMMATGCDVRVAFKVGSTNSMKALGLDEDYGSIYAGKFANIIFVDRKFEVQRVIFKGTEQKEVRK